MSYSHTAKSWRRAVQFRGVSFFCWLALKVQLCLSKRTCIVVPMHLLLSALRAVSLEPRDLLLGFEYKCTRLIGGEMSGNIKGYTKGERGPDPLDCA
jgi:hypothetical protein